MVGPVCGLCGKSFRTANGLTWHQAHLHTAWAGTPVPVAARVAQEEVWGADTAKTLADRRILRLRWDFGLDKNSSRYARDKG